MSEDKISSLASVKVDAWGTGERNDCYWNIAANQLGEGATAQEIQALCEQLQAYNQEKNTAIQKQGEMLNAGDQVFIPLEYAMDEIQTNVSTKQEEVTTAQGELETAQGELSTASGEVDSTLGAYQTAMAAFQNAAEDDENKASLQSAMEDAKQAYLDAVQKQEEAQAKVEEKQQEIETKKGELEQYKTELSELKEEYAEEKEEYETELAQLDEQIASIDTSIQETETSLEQAKAEQEAAASQQEDAKNLGVTKDDEGNYTLDDSNLTPEQLEAAKINSENMMTAKEYAGKEAEEEKIIDGGRTKTVKYADGTSAEFYRDPETGEWSALPSVMYDGEGNATYTAKVEAEDVENGTARLAGNEGNEELTEELTAIANNIRTNPEGAMEFINDYVENGNTEAIVELAQIYASDDDVSSLLNAYKDNPEMCSQVVSALQQAYDEGDDTRKEEIAQILANDVEKSLADTSGTYYGQGTTVYSADEALKAIFGSDENGNYNISDELMTDIKRIYDQVGTENERSLEKSLDGKNFYSYGNRIDQAGIMDNADLASSYISDVQQEQMWGTETETLKNYFNAFDYDNSQAIKDKSNEAYKTTNVNDNTVEKLLDGVDTSNMTKEDAQTIIGKLYSHYNNSDKIVDTIRNMSSGDQEKYMPILAELYVLANQEE